MQVHQTIINRADVLEDTTPQLGGTLDSNSKQVRWSKGSDVASANALTLGDDGNYFDITGTTSITSIVTKAIGTVAILHFDGILTLTHHATDLILPKELNIKTAAGDEAMFVEYATGDWRCVSYKSYGLIDLIAGVIPTLTDWTNDPTDAADITDGDITTFCTTGNKVAAGAYQNAIFEWDLGAFYQVMITGVGAVAATAGTPAATVSFYNGAAWITGEASLVYSTGVTSFTMHGAMASKVRLNLYSNAAATITPNIREFNVWRII